MKISALPRSSYHLLCLVAAALLLMLGVLTVAEPASAKGSIVHVGDSNAPGCIDFGTGIGFVDCETTLTGGQSVLAQTTTIPGDLGVEWDYVGPYQGHTITSESSELAGTPGTCATGDYFDSGNAYPEFSYDFEYPGVCYYYCKLHGAALMRGVVIVLVGTITTTTTTTTTCPPAGCQTTTTTTMPIPPTTTTTIPGNAAGFGTGGVVTTAIGLTSGANALVVQSDGKLVAAGGANFIGPSGQSTQTFALSRYNTDGSLDTTFGAGGVVTQPSGHNYAVNALSIQSDGKLVAAYGPVLSRYNTDGSLDMTFGSGGIATTILNGYSYGAQALTIQPDGKLVTAGEAQGNPFIGPVLALIRYNTDGSLDGTFGSGGFVKTSFGTNNDISYAKAVVIQSDGKIVAAGYFYNNSHGYQSGFALSRYNTNGSLDTTFGTGGIVTTSSFVGGNNSASALVVQSDGKLVAAGSSYLVRYNTDGTLDTTFNSTGIVTTGSGGLPKALAIQPDGKLVVAGPGWDDDPPNARFFLARYNSDGSQDTAFGTEGIITTAIGIGSAANALAIQSDGKLVAAGYGRMGYQMGSLFALARYNTNGSLNQSAGPNPDSLTPVNISTAPSVAQSFSAVYFDPNGYLNITDASLFLSGITHNEWVHYSPQTYQFTMTGVAGSCFPGQATTLSDGNLTLDCSASSASSSWTALGVVFNLTPQPSLSGYPYLLMISAVDQSNASNSKTPGYWIVNRRPSAESVAPIHNMGETGMGQMFTAVYSDPDGWQNIAAANFYLSGNGGIHNEWLHYLVAPNVFTMMGTNDVCTPGQMKMLSNGYLTLDCSSSSISGSGNVLTIVFQVTPEMSSSGMMYDIFTAASDQAGAAYAIFAGTWQIQ